MRTADKSIHTFLWIFMKLPSISSDRSSLGYGSKASGQKSPRGSDFSLIFTLSHRATVSQQLLQICLSWQMPKTNMKSKAGNHNVCSNSYNTRKRMQQNEQSQRSNKQCSYDAHLFFWFCICQFVFLGKCQRQM